MAACPCFGSPARNRSAVRHGWASPAGRSPANHRKSHPFTGGRCPRPCIGIRERALLISLLPADFPQAQNIHVSAPVLAFTFAISILTDALFGLVPAVQAARTDPKQCLQQSARTSTASRRQNLLRSALAVTEVSLTCVLLIGAGLRSERMDCLLDLRRKGSNIPVDRSWNTINVFPLECCA